MNPTKTTVAYTEIDFLGHTVNAEGSKNFTLQNKGYKKPAGPRKPQGTPTNTRITPVLPKAYPKFQ